MKFFIYPVTTAQLAEFTAPHFSGYADLIAGPGDTTFAGNGFVAVRDSNSIPAEGLDVYDNPDLLKRYQALPWDLFNHDFRPDNATHYHAGMNRRISSWVALDDHAGHFPRYRDRELFDPAGRVDWIGYFEVGHGRVRVLPQVLNLVRKLPKARFWVPSVSNAPGGNLWLPVKYHGGCALIADIRDINAEKCSRIGGICTSRGYSPMESGIS